MDSKMDNRSLVIYTDFFFSTFMQHYQLYQYILTAPRDESRFVSQLTVEPPLPTQPLTDGQHPSIHEYEQRLKEIQSQRTEVAELVAPEPPQENIEITQDITACTQAQVSVTK